MKNYKACFVLMSALIFAVPLSACSNQNAADQSTTNATNKSNTPKQTIAIKKVNSLKSTKPELPKATSINWNSPSNGPYPTLTPQEQIWIDVSVKNQKVYIKDGQKTLYTMIASTGLNTEPDNSTPFGTFYVQPERGDWFYSPTYQEGAEYWVSWKNHGEFLFHSVPMNQEKQVIPNVAEKLGQKASHGCIHLTVADAKWIYDHIKTGTKVVIRE